MNLAVLIPCYNEESTVSLVIKEFRNALPEARIYVCDNNSSDNTAKVANEAGVQVLYEGQQGKGAAVRRLFSDVEADAYLLVDGDCTYDAQSAERMLEAFSLHGLDMVVGRRVATGDEAAYRAGHRAGNKIISGFLGVIFQSRFKDMLSGYRLLSRRFVKSFPALASGFEIETELAVHALELRMPWREIDTPYMARPEESFSKLNTWGDGLKIVLTIMVLFRQERPFVFFFIGFSVLFAISLALGVPIVLEFMESGEVPRFPTAILSTGVMLLAVLSLVSGLVLDTVTRGRREMKRLFYLSIPFQRQE